jgi:hypothetical protein
VYNAYHLISDNDIITLFDSHISMSGNKRKNQLGAYIPEDATVDELFLDGVLNNFQKSHVHGHRWAGVCAICICVESRQLSITVISNLQMI